MLYIMGASPRVPERLPRRAARGLRARLRFRNAPGNSPAVLAIRYVAKNHLAISMSADRCGAKASQSS